MVENCYFPCLVTSYSPDELNKKMEGITLFSGETHVSGVRRYAFYNQALGYAQVRAFSNDEFSIGRLFAFDDAWEETPEFRSAVHFRDQALPTKDTLEAVAFIFKHSYVQGQSVALYLESLVSKYKELVLAMRPGSDSIVGSKFLEGTRDRFTDLIGDSDTGILKKRQRQLFGFELRGKLL